MKCFRCYSAELAVGHMCRGDESCLRCGETLLVRVVEVEQRGKLMVFTSVTQPCKCQPKVMSKPRRTK